MLVPALAKVYESQEFKDFMGSRGFGTIYCRAEPSSRRSWPSRDAEPGRGDEGAGRWRAERIGRPAGPAMRRVNDAVFGVVLLLRPPPSSWLARGFPAMPGQDFGPALFPDLIAAGFACAALGCWSGPGCARPEFAGAIVRGWDWARSGGQAGRRAAGHRRARGLVILRLGPRRLPDRRHRCITGSADGPLPRRGRCRSLRRGAGACLVIDWMLPPAPAGAAAARSAAPGSSGEHARGAAIQAWSSSTPTTCWSCPGARPVRAVRRRHAGPDRHHGDGPPGAGHLLHGAGARRSPPSSPRPPWRSTPATSRAPWSASRARPPRPPMSRTPTG